MPPAFVASLAKWFAVFQEHYRQELSPELFEIYARALCDLSPGELERACLTLLRSSKFFPKVAEILEVAKPSRSDQATLEAERAWENYQRRIHTWWRDDEGLERPLASRGKLIYPPALDAATDYAVRACGGRLAIEYCSLERFPFLRRDFLAAHVRFHQTDGLKALPARVADLAPELRESVQKLLGTKEA